MLNTAEMLQSKSSAFTLDEIDYSVFSNDAFQPPETSEIRFLKEKFYEDLAAIMKKDIKIPEEKAQVDEKLELLTFIYGGENRFYERFYIARGENVTKASKQLKSMLELRKKILGDKMVSSITLTKKFK